MFAWWWLVVMFFLGAFVGVMIMGFCTMNDSDLKNAKKWWDDEQ